LKTAEIAGDKLADGAEFGSQILMGLREVDGEAFGGGCAGGLRQAENQGDEAMANGGERQVFDNADEAAQPGTDDGDDFERDFGMFAAKILEILAGDEEHFRIDERGSRGGIIAAVENGEFGEGAAGAFDGEDLFAASGRHFEDANFAGGDEEKTGARVAFAEEQLTLAEAAMDDARGEGAHFGVGERGEERRLPEDGFVIVKRHGVFSPGAYHMAERRRRNWQGVYFQVRSRGRERGHFKSESEL
jgi:hypothetical protein